MNVEDYIDAASRRPWAWSGGIDGWRGHDCTIFPANWSVALTGNDPAADLRGTYHNREEAEAMVSKAGGIVPLVAARLVTAGWRAADEAQDGDLAVISIPLGQGRHFQTPALMAKRHWITADPKRLLAFPGSLHTLMIWRAA